MAINGDAYNNVYVRSQKGASGSEAWLSRTYEAELRAYPLPPLAPSATKAKAKASGSGAVGRSSSSNRLRQGTSTSTDMNTRGDLVLALLAYRGIELVACARSSTVFVVQATPTPGGAPSRVGVIELHPDGRLSYFVEPAPMHGPHSGAHSSSTRPATTSAWRGDPLQYAGTEAAALSNGDPHTAREWLMGTAASEFPYAVVRLAQVLSVPGTAPDLVVTSHEGYDLGGEFEYYIGNFVGGHGGLHARHMRIPAVFAGAGVRPGTHVAAATAEDVGATLHALIGSPHARPSLTFLRDHADDPMVRALEHSDSAAADLLRGSPIAGCLA